MLVYKSVLFGAIRQKSTSTFIYVCFPARLINDIWREYQRLYRELLSCLSLNWKQQLKSCTFFFLHSSIGYIFEIRTSFITLLINECFSWKRYSLWHDTGDGVRRKPSTYLPWERTMAILKGLQLHTRKGWKLIFHQILFFFKTNLLDG